MAGDKPREDLVYLAKLAEQAERFDEMVEQMKTVAAFPDERGAAQVRFGCGVASTPSDNAFWPVRRRSGGRLRSAAR